MNGQRKKIKRGRRSMCMLILLYFSPSRLYSIYLAGSTIRLFLSRSNMVKFNVQEILGDQIVDILINF
jgi:hypothetical protein